MGIVERVAARAVLFPEESPKVKTAGAFPGEPSTQTPPREIPKDHPFDKRALKPLSKALFASSVALGHALSSYRHLSRLKSSSVSPDGRMGGKGYVLTLVDMRKKLHEAAESLSLISDTLYDEITGPHWKPKLAQLDENDREDVDRFIEEAKEALADPEAEADEAAAKIEGENDDEDADDNDDEKRVKQASVRIASLRPKFASSSVPDHNSEDTPTDSRDYGLGFGARGQGSGGYANPSNEGNGKGVWGPQSGLPGQAPQSSGDVSTKEEVDADLNSRNAAYRAIYGCDCSGLPQDAAGSVARSDYYNSQSDNLVSVATSELPAPPTAPRSGDNGRGLLDTYYTQEDTADQPVLYDFTTHTTRNPHGQHPGQDHEEPWAFDEEP